MIQFNDGSEKVRIISSTRNWIEQQAIDQLYQTATLPGIECAVGLPDLHAGRGVPVGAAFWSSSHIYPHLVGNDIGCGMALWQTDMQAGKIRVSSALRKLSGLEGPWDGDQISRLEQLNLPVEMESWSLGTIGGGNHFAEFQKIEHIFSPHLFEMAGLDARQIFLLIHSGSRGIGETILQDHMRQFQSCGLQLGSEPCSKYLSRHDQAMLWAELNRDIIAERFLSKLGMSAQKVLDIFHNSVTPYGNGWLHRKGAAPADKPLIVIPGSRGAWTYLVAPRSEAADISLHSLAHGAGRRWSRTDARSKLAKNFTASGLERTILGSRVICEDRNLIFEEAPQAYKNIETVVEDLRNAGLIEIVAKLRPVITYKVKKA